MHISSTAFLLTLLSASAFAAPIDDASQVDTNTTDTSRIEARGVHGYISAYPSAACIGKQVGVAPNLPGMECVKWSPLSDWVGINWSSQVTGGGIMVFKDENCEDVVGSSILAPLNKDATCVHVGQHDGAWKGGWKSVKFSRHAK